MADFDYKKRLGSGSFGEVWLARDRALGVDRAVKLVNPSKIHDPTNFYSEPQALVALEHANIVRVFDAGTLKDKRLYISMEYMPRGSVEDVYEGGVAPTRSAIQIVCDVARALEYAHGKKYVHRDVKPANILLAKGGSAKLSDFGLATQGAGDGTASGYGYFAHRAPEMLKGKADFRSDIYALGVTLYRLVNGDAILPAGSGSEIRQLIAAGEFPDRRQYQPFLPKKLRQIINRSMSVGPADRFESAQAFRNALEQVPIWCDWEAHTIPHGSRWTANIDSLKFEASLTHPAKNCWSFRLMKGRASGLRNVNADSISGADEKVVRKKAEAVLQRITFTGK